MPRSDLKSELQTKIKEICRYPSPSLEGSNFSADKQKQKVYFIFNKLIKYKQYVKQPVDQIKVSFHKPVKALLLDQQVVFEPAHNIELAQKDHAKKIKEQSTIRKIFKRRKESALYNKLKEKFLERRLNIMVNSQSKSNLTKENDNEKATSCEDLWKYNPHEYKNKVNRFESTISTENCELTAKYNQFSDSNLHSNFNSQKSPKHKNKQMIKSKSRSNMRNSNLQKLSMKPRMFEAREYLRGLSKIKQFQTDKLYNSKRRNRIQSSCVKLCSNKDFQATKQDIGISAKLDVIEKPFQRNRSRIRFKQRCFSSSCNRSFVLFGTNLLNCK